MEFKFSSYENCLNFAVEENYKFVNLSNALESNEKSILLRHDIDFSLDHAIKFAEIEKSLDVQATYFVRTHCKYYNALSYSSKEILNKLESLGHIVGLHFEEDYYPEENLLSQKTLMKSSSHITGLTVQKKKLILKNTQKLHLNCQALMI